MRQLRKTVYENISLQIRCWQFLQNFTRSLLIQGMMKIARRQTQVVIKTVQQYMKAYTICILINLYQYNSISTLSHLSIFKLMNFTHHCHFHSNQILSYFCPNIQCTLPLCKQCQPIHIKKHIQQHLDNDIISFSQAYQQATTKIQEYLTSKRKQIKQKHKQLDQDREIVLKMIDSYYSKTSRDIEQAKEKLHHVEEKINKLKKGSIKTLIFYFSGDIPLENISIEFEPLSAKIKQTIQKDESSNAQQKILQVNSREKYCPTSNNMASKLLQRDNIVSFDQNNAFRNIDQIGFGDKNKQKTRKSIFQVSKKTSDHVLNKYNYNVNLIAGQQGQSIDLELQKKRQQKNKRIQDITVESKVKNHDKDPQTPISFEHRYTHKFTGTEQYEIYKREKQDNVIRHQQRLNQNKENHQQKILKTTDLDFQYKLPENKLISVNNTKPLNISNNQTSLSSQKRSLSHAQLSRNQTNKKESNDYDLKKQVLAPEQIRKMLEKRMQERNRILTIKKSQDYAAPPSSLSDGRRALQTRDSIINQIYKDQNP